MFRVIIPMRMASTRLPEKALQLINQKPMIQHVYERALHSQAASVVIATDHPLIQKAALSFGAEVCMTNPTNASGTDRVAEAVVALGYSPDEIIVNVQGDQPLIDPTHIDQVASHLSQFDHLKIATLCTRFTTAAEVFNPSLVKVVLNRRSHALYFSRAPIPWDRHQFQTPDKVQLAEEYYQHIGIYAYRADFLEEYVKWEVCPMEEQEGLEQLRVLWNGYRIYVGLVERPPAPEVNTLDDLEKVRQLIAENPHLYP